VEGEDVVREFRRMPNLDAPDRFTTLQVAFLVEARTHSADAAGG
jgi:hypothetical protein